MKLILYVGLWFACSISQADIIKLKNGDQLTGTLVKADNEQVWWKSDLLGEISFSSKHIVNLSSYILEYKNKQPIIPVWENSGRLSISGSKKDKDVKKEEWDVLVETEYKKLDQRHKIKIRYERDVDNDGYTEEEYFTGYNYSWFFTPKWFIDYSLSAEKNEAKNLETQYVAGAGVGYQFWSTETHHLEVGLGISHISKNFFISTLEDDEYFAGRWQLNGWIKPAPKLRLFHGHEFFQSLSSTDYELETDSGIRFIFSPAMYGELTYEWDYDSASTTDKNQSTWVLSLGYDW